MHLSFEELYRQLHVRVYNLVLDYIQQPQDAEEVTADVFVEVYEKLSQFRSEASVETWLYRIAVNKCLDFIRYQNRKKRKGFIQSLFGTKPEEITEPALTLHPGIAAEQKEQATILFNSLNQLNEKQRTAFILCYVEELPQKEVAAIMQTSLKAVESLLQRAKAHLKNILEKEYGLRRKN